VCRHLAYLGPPASLRSLLIDPPHSLYRQAWAPRLQRHGTVNADGFGIGWYAGADPVPARYRRGEPIWGDPSLTDIARVTTSGAVLAAVRSATPGTAAGPEAAAPFGCGPWLFSHNGAVPGWRDWGEAAYQSWAGDVPRSLLSSLEALTDSALLWAITRQRLRAGLPLDAALAGTVGAVEAAGGTGRLNLLLTDGRSVAATACGDTLWYRQTPSAPGRDGAASVTVASEPDDDEPGWTEVPDRHVLTATRSLARVRPLGDLSDRGSPAGHGSPRYHGSPTTTTQPQATIQPQATTSAPKGIATK
jgi:glutamine amidotransferase